MISQIVLSCLLAVAASFPHLGLVNQGPQSGPLTPAYGDLVQTPRGLASIALEGFSEDLDQDGYVDPVGQATAPVAVAHQVAHVPAVDGHVAVAHAPAAVAYAPAAVAYAPAAVAHAPVAVAQNVANVAVAHTHAAPVATAAIPAASYAYNYASPVS